MPQDDIRKEALEARSSSDEGSGFVSPQNYDPSTEPTISSVRVDSAYSQPTRIDPNAAIHNGVVPVAEFSQPTARNLVALPAGYLLHEFTIETVLGTGGFGITYLARDNNLQCQVAIKEYLPNDLAVRTGGQTVCARTESDTHGYRIGLDGFLAESRVLASFRHPNIVRVTRFFEANNTAYMVMDYEKGEPLRDWIKQHGPIGESQLLSMFLPLLEGLDVVHKARVLHRDIKPANIYVREGDGSLVLLDFGAARYASSGDSRSLTSIVTPGYAPFEQYHTHGAQGPWSDLYALGGVLYWMVTGEKPLEAPARVRSDTMPSAASSSKGRYSERVLRAIDWALTPDEADRPKSVAQFKDVLTGVVAAPPPPISAAGNARDNSGTTKPSGKRHWMLGVAGAVLLAVGGLAFFAKVEKAAEPETAAPTAMIAGVTESKDAANKEAPNSTAPKKASVVAKKVNKEPEPVAAVPAAAKPDATEKPKEKAATTVVPTATVILDVIPQGEIILDGKRAGVSPPLTRLTVSAGVKHKIEIHGTGLPHYWTVELQARRKARNTRKFPASEFLRPVVGAGAMSLFQGGDALVPACRLRLPAPRSPPANAAACGRNTPTGCS